MKCERGARSTVLAITNAPIRIHMELKCQDLGNNPLSWEIFRNNHYLPVKSGSCHHNVFIQVNLWYIFSNFVYNTSMDTSQIVHNHSYKCYKHFLCKKRWSQNGCIGFPYGNKEHERWTRSVRRLHKQDPSKKEGKEAQPSCLADVYTQHVYVFLLQE